MVKKNGQACQPKCFLSHNLINKLSVIVGSCEIVQERAGSSGHFDAECSHRIDTIQQIARVMADELNEHECEIETLRKLPMATDQGSPFEIKVKH